MPHASTSTQRTLEGPTLLDVRRFNMSMKSLVGAMFFGCPINPWTIVPWNDATFRENYWICQIVRFFAASASDSGFQRYYYYLEMSQHVDIAAWDPRSAWTRVHADVARDFKYALTLGTPTERNISSISVGDAQVSVLFRDRLERLAEAITRFERLLEEGDDVLEARFQEFLEKNPALIDIYGEVIPHPNWVYPRDTLSPIKKESLVPDFVVRYHGDRYMLVEIERPSKRLGTIHGEPRSDVNQAAFQLAEWRDFIDHHYDLIKGEFPHITGSSPGLIVIGRSRRGSVGPDYDLDGYKRYLRKLFANSEVFTYDDLLVRAKLAYCRLCALPNEPLPL